MYYPNHSMFHLLPQTCFYQGPIRLTASGALNELCVYFSDECRKQLWQRPQRMADLKPSSFFPFQVP